MAKPASIIATLRRGQKLAHAGRQAESLAAFEAVGPSNDVRLLVQHALALARAGQGEAARAKAEAAADAAPKDVVPALFHAYLTLRFGSPDQAAPEIERAAKLSRTNPIVPTLAAAAELLAGDPVKGCRQLLAGPLTDNLDILGWVLALVEHRIFEAVGTDSAAVPPESEHDLKHDTPPRKPPAGSAAAAARRGERLLESGRPHTALAYLERAATLKPKDPDIRAMYGAALFEAGQFDRAEEQLAAVPADGLLGGVAQFYRAANAYRLGRPETAIELLDSMPMTGDAFHYREWCDYVRGMALVAMGRPDRAAEHLAAFIDTEPALVERRLNKAVELLGRSP